jgi:hypothetical protein
VVADARRIYSSPDCRGNQQATASLDRDPRGGESLNEAGEIDGVPVLWEDGPGPWTASLVFGVGTRHETFRTVTRSTSAENCRYM